MAKGRHFPSLSIIVPFRNELAALPGLVSSLVGQKYEGQLEIILVDDHSVDGSTDLLDEIDLPDRVGIYHQIPGSFGKKEALMLGVAHSNAEWLLFTDADCTHHELWASTMVNEALTADKKMITGPVISTQREDWVAQYQVNETAAFIAISGGAIASGLHAMANGANMLVKNELLDRNDPFNKLSSPSGDDLFLAEHYFAQEQLGFCKSHYAVVSTRSPKDRTELISQKLRWASKNQLMKNPALKVSMAIAVAMPLMLFLLSVSALFLGIQTLIVAAILFLTKVIMDHVLINSSLIWLGQRQVFLKTVKLQVYNILINAFVGINVLLRGNHFDWKGRKY